MITSGIADATVMYNNFERKRLSLDQVGTLPFSITDAASTATALWRTHKKYFEAKNQHKGVKFLGYVMHGGGELFSLKDPILSVADMKRMKLRSPPGDVAKAVGRTGRRSYSRRASRRSTWCPRGSSTGWSSRSATSGSSR